jgi:hypothetical protein
LTRKMDQNCYVGPTIEAMGSVRLDYLFFYVDLFVFVWTKKKKCFKGIH